MYTYVLRMINLKLYAFYLDNVAEVPVQPVLMKKQIPNLVRAILRFRALLLQSIADIEKQIKGDDDSASSGDSNTSIFISPQRKVKRRKT